MTQLPPIPIGNSKLALLIQRIYARLDEVAITSFAGGEIKRTSSGTMLIVKPGNKAGQQSEGITFGGEYNELTRSACKKNQIWIIQTGTNKGTYLCLKDSPTNNPWQGTDWISFPMGDTVGAWT